MKIEEKTMYATEDNRLFDKRADAEKHALSLYIDEVVDKSCLMHPEARENARDFLMGLEHGNLKDEKFAAYLRMLADRCMP